MLAYTIKFYLEKSFKLGNSPSFQNLELLLKYINFHNNEHWYMYNIKQS